MRLKRLHLFNIFGNHLLHGTKRSRHSVGAACLQAVERIAGPDKRSQFGKSEQIGPKTAYVWKAENRCSVLAGLQLNPAPVSLVFPRLKAVISASIYAGGELRDCGKLKQGANRQIHPHKALNICNDLGYQQRMATELEKIVMNSHLLEAENMSPNCGEPFLHE